MIVSIFIISLFVTALTPLAASGEVWVDPSGTDAPGNGSISSPYQTIGYALSQVGQNAVVHVNPGTYHESIAIPEGTGVIGADRDTVIIDSYGYGMSSVTMTAATSFIANCTLLNSSGYGVHFLPFFSGVHGGGTVINCLITNVHVGIIMEASLGTYDVNIIDTVITNTQNDGMHFPVYENSSLTALIDNCIIENNNSTNDGIDIDIEGYADITISPTPSSATMATTASRATLREANRAGVAEPFVWILTCATRTKRMDSSWKLIHKTLMERL